MRALTWLTRVLLLVLVLMYLAAQLGLAYSQRWAGFATYGLPALLGAVVVLELMLSSERAQAWWRRVFKRPKG